MPQRSKVHSLPGDVVSELNQRLMARGFGGYAELAAWLEGQGFEISESSVRRYGAKIASRLASIQKATEVASALVDVTGDDSTKLAAASQQLIQQRMFDLLVESHDGNIDELSRAARALATSARASVSLQDARARAKREASAAVAKEAKRRGLSPEVSAALRKVIEGTGDDEAVEAVRAGL